MASSESTKIGASPAIPDQRTLALMNIYVANTAKALNDVAVLCEQKVHEVDRR
jgi:hypothetical protein